MTKSSTILTEYFSATIEVLGGFMLTIIVLPPFGSININACYSSSIIQEDISKWYFISKFFTVSSETSSLQGEASKSVKWKSYFQINTGTTTFRTVTMYWCRPQHFSTIHSTMNLTQPDAFMKSFTLDFRSHWSDYGNFTEIVRNNHF